MKKIFIKKKKVILAAAAVACCIAFQGCSKNEVVRSRTFEKIGTFIQVSVYTSEEEKAQKAFDTVSAVFDEVNIQMSAHREDSLLSRINRASGIEPVRIPEGLFGLIENSLAYSEKTDGAFDLTVGPVIKLYGFYRNKGYLPSKKELKKTLELVGWKNVRMKPEDSSVFLAKKGMLLDLGAIAKGYAVDLAIERLKKQGVADALVNAGGNLYALGDKDGDGWSVGVQHPLNENEIYLTLGMKDLAIATSGCYQRYVTVGGKTYCHILDARTGLAINNGMLSATIIGPNAKDTDALATCVMLLGPDEGFAFLRDFKGFEGLILYLPPGEPAKMLEKRTPGFSRFIR